MDSALQKELQKRIEAFVTDLEGLVRRAALQAVAQALGGSANVRALEPQPKRQRAAKGTTKPAKAAPKKRIRRTTADLERTAEAIFDHISKHPGQRAEDIKAALRIDTAAWALPVKKLIDDGRIVTKGAKRSTTYAAK